MYHFNFLSFKLHSKHSQKFDQKNHSNVADLLLFSYFSRPQMEEAAEGHFTTEAQQWNQDEQTPTVSGQVIFTLRPDWPNSLDCTDLN